VALTPPLSAVRFVPVVFTLTPPRTPIVRADYRIGVPGPGYYAEILNSDAAIYGGGNIGNAGGVETEAIPAHGFQQSLRLTVPPLACLYLKRR
jgi:1,4-alpha-glucan branching enzyme